MKYSVSSSQTATSECEHDHHMLLLCASTTPLLSEAVDVARATLRTPVQETIDEARIVVDDVETDLLVHTSLTRGLTTASSLTSIISPFSSWRTH